MPRYTLSDHDKGRVPVKDGGTAPRPTRGEQRQAEAEELAAETAKAIEGGRSKPRPERPRKAAAALDDLATLAKPATPAGKE